MENVSPHTIYILSGLEHYYKNDFRVVRAAQKLTRSYKWIKVTVANGNAFVGSGTLPVPKNLFRSSGIIQLSGDMLEMEDLINSSVSIIATNPYKFVSLALTMRGRASCGWKRRGIESPAALARKAPTSAAHWLLSHASLQLASRKGGLFLHTNQQWESNSPLVYPMVCCFCFPPCFLWAQ